MLILPSDLPLITAADVGSLIRTAGGAAFICIAPDRRGDGTNALLVRPPRVIPYKFGPGSFNRHSQLALDHAVQVQTCQLSSFGLDVDLPEDLELYRSSSRIAE